MRKARREILGPLLLVIVSILWGTSFPLIKIAVSRINAGEYVAFRFSLSVVLLLPYFAHSLLRNRVSFSRPLGPGSF